MAATSRLIIASRDDHWRLPARITAVERLAEIVERLVPGEAIGVWIHLLAGSKGAYRTQVP